MAESSHSPGPPRWATQGFAPLARAIAGRRWFPLWAIVHHRGRRSGTEYATPVAVIPTRSKEVMLIGLPWGPTTQWARNVLAAGGAGVTWKGREQQTTQPRLIDGIEAAALVKSPFTGIVRRFPLALVMTRS
jgi:deazaflavin-dependent oxidoreductase (nitroreductase family)